MIYHIVFYYTYLIARIKHPAPIVMSSALVWLNIWCHLICLFKFIEVNVNVEILPRINLDYYDTKLALALIAFLSIGGTYLFYRHRVAQVEKKIQGLRLKPWMGYSIVLASTIVPIVLIIYMSK